MSAEKPDQEVLNSPGRDDQKNNKEGEEKQQTQAVEKSEHNRSSQAAQEEEPELKDLESSLLALERLDRASPDLWPDHFPGVSQFVPLATPQDSPAIGFPLRAGDDGMIMTAEDISAIHHLSSMPVSSLLSEVKRLHDVAYELGVEERKENVRGKYLNIFKRRRC